MKVWVLQGSDEGQLYSSVHLTQKGCALACIADVLEFHGINDKEDALRVMNDCYAYTETDGEQTEPFEWEYEKMKGMSSNELWKIFNDWVEISWDVMTDRSFFISAESMEIQG